MPYLDPLRLASWAWLAWIVYWYIAANFVKATVSTELPITRLPYQLTVVAGALLVFHSRSHSLFYGSLYHNANVEWVGFAITLIGLAYSVWARVHLGRNWSGVVTLKEDHKLIRSGPYRMTRHPIYTGLILAMLGSAISHGTGDAFLGCVLVMIGFMLKLRREEKLMISQFGDEYRQFKREVPALIPFLF
jgi:protein-S-isoprenylcysteine O-methyltransferase Ste14